MKRATVSIDAIAGDQALSVAQRRFLLRVGRAIEDEGHARSVDPRRNARVSRALETKGYTRWNALTRFELTERGALRYRAELSHQRHCAGCPMCEGLR